MIELYYSNIRLHAFLHNNTSVVFDDIVAQVISKIDAQLTQKEWFYNFMFGNVSLIATDFIDQHVLSKPYVEIKKKLVLN
jgi:hypothetical protein